MIYQGDQYMNKTAIALPVLLLLAVSLYGQDYGQYGNALIKSIHDNDFQKVKSLIEKGADVNSKDGYGHSALRNAADTGNLNLVKLLLLHGASTKPEANKGMTLLMAFAACGDIHEVDLRRGLGEHINQKDDYYRSAIHYAAANGQSDMVKYLIGKGADANANAAGDLPLVDACIKGDLATVKILLEYGAEINAGGVQGMTALMQASANHRVEIVRLLIQKGADVNKKSVYYSTLSFARKFGDPELVLILINAGAKE
jgi:uncharacterized protein